MAQVQRLECSACPFFLEGSPRATVCPRCQRPLLARYDLTPLAELDRRLLAGRVRSLWRYLEVLPLEPATEPVSLGEGLTPIVPLRRLGKALGLPGLLAKNEAFNPTGSFKDRGMSVAVTAASQRGVKALQLPSAGNAAGSAAAYAARAGLSVRVAMPADTPLANQQECAALGARVHRVQGSLREAGAWLRQQPGDAFDLSTLKEPYRLEGKKTMGYELVEQLGFQLPEVIVYPTGGGTGLIGMWKAFAEMQEAGWLGTERPRMVAVQASGCAPIVHAFEQGLEEAVPIQMPTTIASGLRVPAAIGDRLMLAALRDSQGTALAVSDADLTQAAQRLARSEGLMVAPEAAATIAALPRLLDLGKIRREDRVVVFLTAGGAKYAEFWNLAAGIP